MSGIGMVWARQQRVGRPMAKVLLLLLAEISNEQGETYQSQQYLADILEVSRKAVNENMAYLEERGYIEVKGRVDPVTKKRMTNRVVVLIGELQAAPSPRKLIDETHVTLSDTDPETHVTLGHENTPDPCNAALQLVNNTQILKQEASMSDADAPTQNTKQFDPIVHKLCEHLADWIGRNTGKRPSVGAQWLSACERLMRIDGRSPEQVKACIDWCQSNEFWQGNILSMPKLREKYDQLSLAARNERKPQSRVNRTLQAGAAMVARLEAQEQQQRKELQ